MTPPDTLDGFLQDCQENSGSLFRWGSYSGLAAAFTHNPNRKIQCSLCLQIIPKLHHYYVIKPVYYPPYLPNSEPYVSPLPAFAVNVCSECFVMSDWIIAVPSTPIEYKPPYVNCMTMKLKGLVFLKLEKQSKQPIKRAQ
jgi:hypothetical protein